MDASDSHINARNQSVLFMAYYLKTMVTSMVIREFGGNY
ncbi:MAG: hypothetical protein JWO03_3763 [Bacteroidetes bacterium]|nr:hypothetical protein [Bacteroidota bacterium]